MRSFSPHPISAKRVPQRTCVACRKVKAKSELIRLVRLIDGSVEVDASGKGEGRGAYLCSAQECWQIGLKGGRIEHALRTTLTASNREQLSKSGERFGEGEAGGANGV